ncbi:hypothetical protein [Neorhizobium tomejilense]|uniref:hypothetical protein n=1 Tax=Neorhizobium tomejilense TaxID=2093828 RepID=UPI00155F07BB|nr:hypothetical protein [Neorhizobium tomejilense]
MTDPTIDVPDSRELISAISLIRADIAKTRTVIAQLTDEATRKEQILHSLQQMIRGNNGSAGPSKGRNSKKEPGYRTVLRLARDIMIQEGRPLDRYEALSKVMEAGFAPDVSNPVQFVAKTLWASEKFIPTNKGYWPSDLPLPDGVVQSDRRRSA